MKFRTAALLGALIMAGVAAPGSAQTYSANEVKKSVRQADLVAIVGALGHQVSEEGTGGQVYLIGQTQGGLVYDLTGTACDMNGVPGCQGIKMQVRFDLPGSTTFETVARANQFQHVINTAADFDAGALVFTRYQVLDHGVTMANIRENVNVLLSLIPETLPLAVGEE